MADPVDDDAKKSTTSTDIKDAVETAGSADESIEDDEDEKDNGAKSEAEDDSEDGKKSDEATDDDADAGKKADDDSKKQSDDGKPDAAKDSGYRYTQFAGDGKPETYISNLEKAYENSSAEGIANHQKFQQSQRRLDAIVQAAKGDKDLADKLTAVLSGTKSDASPAGESDVTTDPFLVDAKTKWEETSTKEAQDFIDANPEVVSNPTINAEVKRWMEVFSAEEYKTKGRLMTAGEAMAKAYKHLGYEDKREARKSLSDAKKAVAPTRPQGSRKPVKTATDFTDSQLKFGEAMGVSREKLEKFGK